jgi:hypothetical protein
MKYKLKQLMVRSAAALAATGTALVAHAQTAPTGPDLSSLTDQVNFASVTVAVLAIGAGVAGVYIIIRGVKIIWPLIKG